MKKLNSNTSEGCSLTSSNCVIWDGPDISCLNLCRGDSITDVVYKLATKICELTSATGIDVSGVVFDCILNQGQTEPDTLTATLNLMISKHCALKAQVDSIQVSNSDNVLYRLPACLEYTDGNGDLIQYLTPENYSLKLAQEICSLIASVASANVAIATNASNISDLDDRVTVLENEIDTPLTVTFDSCVENTGTARTMQEAIQLLEDNVCSIRGNVGASADVVAAVARQCPNLSTLDRLANGSGSMSTISGWVSFPTTIADTLTNMWLTVCDMRDRVIELGECCGLVCDDVILDFYFSLNSERTVVTLDFTGSTIPSGFTELPPSTISITDGTLSYSQNFNWTSLAATGTLVIDLSSHGLDPTKTFIFTAQANVMNSSTGAFCGKNTTRMAYYLNNTVQFNITLINSSSVASGSFGPATAISVGSTIANVGQTALVSSSGAGTATIVYTLQTDLGDLQGRLYRNGVQVGTVLESTGVTSAVYNAGFVAGTINEMQLIITDL